MINLKSTDPNTTTATTMGDKAVLVSTDSIYSTTTTTRSHEAVLSSVNLTTRNDARDTINDGTVPTSVVPDTSAANETAVISSNPVNTRLWII